MPLSFDDWRKVEGRIEALIREATPSLFIQSVVIKADAKKNLIWVKELGDQPVPLFTFDYDIKYYDTQPSGNVTTGQPVNTQLLAKKAVVTPKCPKVGETVLILQQHGSRRLPKCLGVLRSKDFVVPV